MRKVFKNLIFGVDVEAGGSIPGIHSMYSIGAAAFSIKSGKPELLGRFEVNLKDLPNTTIDPNTANFWEKYPGAYEHARKNPLDPKVAMTQFDDWVRGFYPKGIFAGWPASFDYAFMAYYYYLFLKKSDPFIGPPFDIRTYGFAAWKLVDWEQYKMENLPKEILPQNQRPHFAVDDAVAQGYAACNIILENIS